MRFWKGGAGVGFVGWWVGGLEGAVGGSDRVVALVRREEARVGL